MGLRTLGVRAGVACTCEQTEQHSIVDKLAQLQKIQQTGLVAILRCPRPEPLVDVCQALADGGVEVVEITFTVPQAHRVLEQVASRLGDRVLLGAGTVLDGPTARTALLSGAQFLVSPHFAPDVLDVALRYGAVCMPGAFTPTEVVRAWQAGADVVKVFPADVLGPGYLKALRGPLPQVRLLPTGGVDLETGPQFLQAGAFALGAGSALAPARLIESGQLEEIRHRAAQYVEMVRQARSGN